MRLSVLYAAALMTLGCWIVPAPVAAQSPCEGCNILTNDCEQQHPNPQIECYSAQDPEGNWYCHAYGGDDLCQTLVMGADGLPPVESGIPATFDLAAPAVGIRTLTDCLGRVRAMALSSEMGEDLRRQTARIEL